MTIPREPKKLESSANDLAGKVEEGLRTYRRLKVTDPRRPSMDELSVMMQLALYYQNLADSLRVRT